MQTNSTLFCTCIIIYHFRGFCYSRFLRLIIKIWTNTIGEVIHNDVAKFTKISIRFPIYQLTKIGLLFSVEVFVKITSYLDSYLIKDTFILISRLQKKILISVPLSQPNKTKRSKNQKDRQLNVFMDRIPKYEFTNIIPVPVPS